MEMMKKNMESLIPHSGDMILVDEVLEVTTEQITTKSIIKKDNAFLEDGKFPTYKTLEIMAQSLGCLRGLYQSDKRNKLGFLLGARRFSIKKPFINIGDEIITKATISLQDESGLGVYDCEVFIGDVLIATSSISALNLSDELLEKVIPNE